MEAGVIMLKQKKGFTMIETLAGIVIISLIFSAALTIIVNVRRQILISNERIVAFNVGQTIRDRVENNYEYNQIFALIDDLDYNVTYENCLESGITDMCETLTYFVNDKDFSQDVTINFKMKDQVSEEFNFILFDVVVVYNNTFSITIAGVIYE
jgi:prepilin-type N-terminal cleavage/methylation domain-containing protein